MLQARCSCNILISCQQEQEKPTQKHTLSMTLECLQLFELVQNALGYTNKRTVAIAYGFLILVFVFSKLLQPHTEDLEYRMPEVSLYEGVDGLVQKEDENGDEIFHKPSALQMVYNFCQSHSLELQLLKPKQLKPFDFVF